MSYVVEGEDIVILPTRRKRSPSSRWNPASWRKDEWKSALFAGRQHVECHYCGERLTRKSATLDHVRPRSAGGADHLSNFLLACAGCNNRRGNTPYRAFVAAVMA